jgi:hypothetical protein
MIYLEGLFSIIMYHIGYTTRLQIHPSLCHAMNCRGAYFSSVESNLQKVKMELKAMKSVRASSGLI